MCGQGHPVFAYAAAPPGMPSFLIPALPGESFQRHHLQEAFLGLSHPHKVSPTIFVESSFSELGQR